MRIREPREHWMLFLLLWGALFGGIPLVMLAGLATGAAPVTGSGSAPLFLVLFPLVAAAVVGLAMRRYLRSGFTLTAEGIEGAHDRERSTVSWSAVDRIEWRHAAPTSDVRVNGRPLPSGPALFAVLADGDAVRLMQSCAAGPEKQRRMVRQLDAAAAAGVLPVEVVREAPTDEGPPGEDGPRGDRASGPAWEQGTVRRWSSSGRGQAMPSVPTDRRDDHGDDRPDGDHDDGPVWPTA